MAQGVAIVGIVIAAGNLKNPLAQHFLIAMVRIAGIAGVMERPRKAADDADLGLDLAKEQDAAVAAQGSPVEIGLQVFPGKSCKGPPYSP